MVVGFETRSIRSFVHNWGWLVLEVPVLSVGLGKYRNRESVRLADKLGWLVRLGAGVIEFIVPL